MAEPSAHNPRPDPGDTPILRANLPSQEFAPTFSRAGLEAMLAAADRNADRRRDNDPPRPDSIHTARLSNGSVVHVLLESHGARTAVRDLESILLPYRNEILEPDRWLFIIERGSIPRPNGDDVRMCREILTELGYRTGIEVQRAVKTVDSAEVIRGMIALGARTDPPTDEVGVLGWRTFSRANLLRPARGDYFRAVDELAQRWLNPSRSP